MFDDEIPMKNKRRKAVIDDGMNPELVNGADFDGYYGIPIIKKPSEIIIPERIIPYSKLNIADKFEDAIATYEMDWIFSDLLIHPDKHIDILKNIFLSAPTVLFIATRRTPFRLQMYIVIELSAVIFKETAFMLFPKFDGATALRILQNIFQKRWLSLA